MSFWTTANTFGLYQCTVSKTLTEVCDTINKLVGPDYPFLPRNEEEVGKVVSKFELKFGLLLEIKRPIKHA